MTQDNAFHVYIADRAARLAAARRGDDYGINEEGRHDADTPDSPAYTRPSRAAQRRIDWCESVFGTVVESQDWLTALHRMTSEPRELGRGAKWQWACGWIEGIAKDIDLNSESEVRWAVQQGSVWFAREDAIGK